MNKPKTSNTKDDVALMVKWFNGVCMLSAQGKQFTPTERNLAIKDEIIKCIRSTQK